MGNTDKQFVRYPTEICEALCIYHLSPIQSNIVNYIIRKTYGWNKTKDYISVSMMAKEMGKDRSTVSKAVNGLRKKGIIGSGEERRGRAFMMWINPPDAWEKPVTLLPHVTKSPHVGKSSQGVWQNHHSKVWQNSNENLCQNRHTQYTYKDNVKNTYQNKGLSAPISPPEDEDNDEIDTMFDGKITVAEFKKLSKEEQDAMWTAEGWGFG